MRKSCGKCIFGKPITQNDIVNGFRVSGVPIIDAELIPESDNKVICVLKGNIHRKDKEQRKCIDYDDKS